MIAASLSFAHTSEDESILKINNVCSGIYFIDKGSVDVYYKDNVNSLLTFEEGSYFGDISFIYQIINRYRFIPKSGSNSKFFSL